VNDQERQSRLEQWIKPSGDDEVTQQERALRMVTQAIEASDLADMSYEIYPKGSYANQTNVRRDSDVDIAVDCHECIYYESFPSVVPKVSKSSYTGPWHGTAWRDGVKKALADKFGKDLDSTGSTAFHLDAVEGSRPNIDIVPGYHFRKYTNAQATAWYDGSKVYKSNGGTIINWPQQQLENGDAKDANSWGRYKEFARALKSAENRLVDTGELDEKPSFMMEMLMYNVQNTTLSSGTLVYAFKATLAELRTGLADKDIYGEWVEPNERKYAFHSSQKWKVPDAREVVNGAWDLLDF
jgi:hypothetical protein